MVIAGLGFLLVLTYSGLILYLYHHWSTSVDLVEDGVELPFVSVIVPMRNEAAVAVDSIAAVLSQDYAGDFEVVVVDDHSEDNSGRLVEDAWQSDERVKVVYLKEHFPEQGGKKLGLSTAIALTEGEIIATTDGDCIVSKGWLRGLVATLSKDKQITTGPVLIDATGDILGAFQAQDLMALAAVTGGGIQSGTNILANGGSLAFRRSAFEKVGGYAGHSSFASGDDVFLVQEIAREYGADSVAYTRSPDSVVWTEPERDIQGFIQQRIRWASKNRAIPDRSVFMLWAFIWLTNIALVGCAVAACFNSTIIWSLVGMLFMKGAVEFLVLRSVARFYGLESTLRWFPVTFFVNMLYVGTMGILANVKHDFTWKGRKVA